MHARVLERRTEWFPDQPAADVELRVLSDRARCVLVGVHLDGSPRPSALAKIRRDVGPGRIDSGARPRLRSDLVSAAAMTELEYTGLQAIELTSEADASFGAVEPLALFRDEATLLMRFVTAPTLRDVVLGESRLRRGPAGLSLTAADGCALAGRWLRAFQERVPGPDLPVRQASRDEVVTLFGRYGEFLAARSGGNGWPDIAQHGAELAAQVLPPELPVAVGHGDYAPRNIFVDQDRLVVFDPMPRWRVPVYEDVCRFAVGLRLLGEQVHTHGRAFSARTMDELEGAVVEAFVAGQDELRAPLRCYQLLILLDKWSAVRSDPGRRSAARLAHLSSRLATGFARREAERVIALAEQAVR